MIQGLNPGRAKRFFSSPKRQVLLCSPHSLPAVQWVPEYLLRIKELGHEADRLSPSGANVNEWSCNFTVPVCPYVMERINFAFTLLTCLFNMEK
jgi:hypothetical protein